MVPTFLGSLFLTLLPPQNQFSQTFHHKLHWRLTGLIPSYTVSLFTSLTSSTPSSFVPFSNMSPSHFFLQLSGSHSMFFFFLQILHVLNLLQTSSSFSCSNWSLTFLQYTDPFVSLSRSGYSFSPTPFTTLPMGAVGVLLLPHCHFQIIVPSCSQKADCILL